MPGREGTAHLLSSVFAKAHSASALSLVSNQTIRGEDDYENQNINDKFNDNGSDVNNQSLNSINGYSRAQSTPTRVHFLSSDSSEESDEELNSLPQIGYKEPSNLKNTLLNVFSIKNRINGIKNFDTPVGVYPGDIEGFPLSLPQANKPVLVPPKPSSTSKPKSKSKYKSENPNPNIFKKIISRKTRVPKMKAFKRIVDDLETEISPFHEEVEHERRITSAWKADTELFSNNPSASYSLLLRKDHNQMMLNYDNLKKFEIINKANESWNNNRRKSSSSLTNDSYKSISRRGSFNNLNGVVNANTAFTRRNSNNAIPQINIVNPVIAPASTSTPLNLNRISKSKQPPTIPFTPLSLTRKRKLNHDETDIEEYLSDDSTISTWNGTFNNKRRLVGASVTNSPKSPALDPFPSRRNSVLLQTMQSASDSLESMSLK